MTTEEYELHVEKGEGNAAQTIANFTNKEDLKVLNEDIRFIKQNDVTLSQKGDFFFDSMLYWLLYLVPGVAFIIFFIITVNRYLLMLMLRKCVRKRQIRLLLNV